MTTETIWLVVGTTGEYSDTSIWQVRAFEDKRVAEALVKELTDWCIANDFHGDDARASDYITPKRPSADPQFYCSRGVGTRYYVIDVPFTGGAEP